MENTTEPTPAELAGLARLALDLGYPRTAAGILTQLQRDVLTGQVSR